jgi:hypothetical protein
MDFSKLSNEFRGEIFDVVTGFIERKLESGEMPMETVMDNNSRESLITSLSTATGEIIEAIYGNEEAYLKY